MSIILSPPPDLEVTFLEVNDSIATGDQLVVTYIVTNEGAGPTFEIQWTDRIVSVEPHALISSKIHE